MEHLRTVFSTIDSRTVCWKGRKFVIEKKRLFCLTISDKGTSIINEKIKIEENWPSVTSLSKLRSLLGFNALFYTDSKGLFNIGRPFN